MEVLVKYRNDRKKEGASLGELKGIDGRINSLFSSASKQDTLDIELLMYRKQLKIEGANSELLSRIDTCIYHMIGTNPSRILDLSVCTLGDSLNEIPVSIDSNNETVRDLTIKAAAALGFSGPHHVRLICSGKHIDNLDAPLSSYHFKNGTKIFICGRLGCNGKCCEQQYNSLYDAYLRDTYNLFKDISPDTLHKMFMLIANSNSKGPLVSSSKLLEALTSHLRDSAFLPRKKEDAVDEGFRTPIICPQSPSNFRENDFIIDNQATTMRNSSDAGPVSEEDLYG
jgi:hypothetical protein